jgi:hypothetical protein
VKLKHVIEIPAGPGGRPGERLLAPNPSLHPPWPVGPDGSRSDFRFMLSRRGSSFGGVCLGPVSERGEPLASARHSILNFMQRGWAAADPERDLVAGEPAWRNRLQFPHSVLVDWHFAHEGWLFVAGVLGRSRDRESTLVERARAVLSTWRWIDEARAPSIPPPTNA